MRTKIDKKLILVVCRGNIIRSPFAETIINRELKRWNLASQFLAISRGTQGTAIDPLPVKFPNITFYKDEYRLSKPTLDKFKVDITNHISKPVDRKIAERVNIILAVDEINKDKLIKLFPDLKSKIHKLSELSGKNEDFTDPETVSEPEKYFKILSGIHNVITIGFPKIFKLVEQNGGE